MNEFSQTLLSTLSGEQAATVLRSPGSTVAPPHDATLGRRALEVLQQLSHDPQALRVESELGAGGMGVVQLARQVALDRHVAVKTLKPALRAASDVEALLAEAWRTGRLEHPNILPVYSLSLDPQGLPVLVMKRIEGVTWGTLIRDPNLMAAHAQGRTPLDEHLRILQQVCNAVHFAHARGIIHRDLKPENVMVGAFGEVYLVDWGIACAPGPAVSLAGTPAYMAPEMLGSAGGQLTVRTDVYLLGAMLYEVLAGKAPHHATNPQELFEVVLRSNPKIPDDAPEELATLVRACMSSDPLKRPESALDVRLRLEAFAQHQGSNALARQVEKRAAELKVLATSAHPDRRRVDELFSECRFGLQMSLAGWSGNQRARELLESVVATMVRFELEHGSARAAEVLLPELKEPGELPALVAAALEREKDKDLQVLRLKSLEQQLDPRLGGRTRTLVALVVGVIWVIFPFLGHVIQVDPATEMVKSAPVALLSAVILTIVALRGRRKAVLLTTLNRQLLRALIPTMTLQAVGVTIAWHLGVTGGEYGAAILAGYWGVITTVIAASLMPPIWPTPLAYFAGAAVALKWPEYRHLATMGSNLVMCANALIVARSRRYSSAEDESSLVH
ncbi:MAG: serine/threonine-protein kinase [Myxococcaceae bacterium]